MNYITKSFNISELTILKTTQLKEFKESLLPCNCQICGKPLTSSDVLDHQHMTSKEIIGENGAGLIRGLLCSNCNVFLGKIENASKRFGIKDLPSALQNIIIYLTQDNLPFIHPNESKRLKIPFKKSDYNKLVKFLKLKNRKIKIKYSKFLTDKIKSEILKYFKSLDEFYELKTSDFQKFINSPNLSKL